MCVATTQNVQTLTVANFLFWTVTAVSKRENFELKDDENLWFERDSKQKNNELSSENEDGFVEWVDGRDGVPVDGGWTEWSAWRCSAPCGKGHQQRSRVCSNPIPKSGGFNCDGEDVEWKRDVLCNGHPCPASSLPPAIRIKVEEEIGKRSLNLEAVEGDAVEIPCESEWVSLVLQTFPGSSLSWYHNDQLVNDRFQSTWFDFIVQSSRIHYWLTEGQTWTLTCNCDVLGRLYNSAKQRWLLDGNLIKESEVNLPITVAAVNVNLTGRWLCTVVLDEKRWLTNLFNVKVTRNISKKEKTDGRRSLIFAAFTVIGCLILFSTCCAFYVISERLRIKDFSNLNRTTSGMDDPTLSKESRIVTCERSRGGSSSKKDQKRSPVGGDGTADGGTQNSRPSGGSEVGSSRSCSGKIGNASIGGPTDKEKTVVRDKGTKSANFDLPQARRVDKRLVCHGIPLVGLAVEPHSYQENDDDSSDGGTVDSWESSVPEPVPLAGLAVGPKPFLLTSRHLDDESLATGSMCVSSDKLSSNEDYVSDSSSCLEWTESSSSAVEGLRHLEWEVDGQEHLFGVHLLPNDDECEEIECIGVPETLDEPEVRRMSPAVSDKKVEMMPTTIDGKSDVPKSVISSSENRISEVLASPVTSDVPSVDCFPKRVDVLLTTNLLVIERESLQPEVEGKKAEVANAYSSPVGRKADEILPVCSAPRRLPHDRKNIKWDKKFEEPFGIASTQKVEAPLAAICPRSIPRKIDASMNFSSLCPNKVERPLSSLYKRNGDDNATHSYNLTKTKQKIRSVDENQTDRSSTYPSTDADGNLYGGSTSKWMSEGPNPLHLDLNECSTAKRDVSNPVSVGDVEVPPKHNACKCMAFPNRSQIAAMVERTLQARLQKPHPPLPTAMSNAGCYVRRTAGTFTRVSPVEMRMAWKLPGFEKNGQACNCKSWRKLPCTYCTFNKLDEKDKTVSQVTNETTGQFVQQNTYGETCQHKVAPAAAADKQSAITENNKHGSTPTVYKPHSWNQARRPARAISTTPPLPPPPPSPATRSVNSWSTSSTPPPPTMPELHQVNLSWMDGRRAGKTKNFRASDQTARQLYLRR